MEKMDNVLKNHLKAFIFFTATAGAALNKCVPRETMAQEYGCRRDITMLLCTYTNYNYYSG